MKHPLLKLEPLIWLLFGQGILLGTILLTPWVLVVGLGVPLGIVPAEALSYERAIALASHIVGRLILLGLIVLPLWKGVHHMRHSFIDFGGAERDALVAPLLYLLATIGSVLALVAVVRI
ncbi:MAG: fumarate reductase subunit D [Deltaproteobacteria bacterium]|jgi:fumarate reductase subunit D|nr:fumarate reductase subunit D [Deltaproteobacteria bacterium]MBW2542440.1 fumarate reductase subunit D [Deltaproteobacteria bacterium]